MYCNVIENFINTVGTYCMLSNHDNYSAVFTTTNPKKTLENIAGVINKLGDCADIKESGKSLIFKMSDGKSYTLFDYTVGVLDETSNLEGSVVELNKRILKYKVISQNDSSLPTLTIESKKHDSNEIIENDEVFVKDFIDNTLHNRIDNYYNLRIDEALDKKNKELFKKLTEEMIITNNTSNRTTQ